MSSRTLGAENGEGHTIIFRNEAHKKFYMEYLPKCRYQDYLHTGAGYGVYELRQGQY